MAIAMQGSWTVSIQSKSAAWPQRFRIEGSSNGVDGVYDESSPAVFVTGAHWGITVEHNPVGPLSWRPSRHRLAHFRSSGGQFLFDIQSDDFGSSGQGDNDFNDLILTCAMVESPSEYVVYGKVKSYKGFCLFNPCFSFPYYLVDKSWQLAELLKYPPTRSILEKLYPERIKEFETKPPFPIPDPGPFRPMLIPNGLEQQPQRRTKESLTLRADLTAGISSREMAKTIKLFPIALPSAVSAKVIDNKTLTRADYLVLARLNDRFKLKPCVVKEVPQTLLRFVEYDRTMAEKLGEPYLGDGNRHELGITSTDDFGNYVFRFTHDELQVVEELASDVAEGESDITEIHPDIIIEFLDAIPGQILYETTPYRNIPKVKRINLCIPAGKLEQPVSACQGGRAIQALGNLMIGSMGTELHDDGTVSNTVSTGPIVSHAAWYGTVDLFACFLDTEPAVKYYTIRYRHEGEGDDKWVYVTEYYSHPKQQTDGTWKSEKIGPDSQELRANDIGDPKITVGAYLNIEDQITHSEWLNTRRDRKLQIHTGIYQNKAGAVEFMIDGYDENGEKVNGAHDWVRLYIDNSWSKGEIESIKLGTEDPGECAHFSLSATNTPLMVNYKVTDEEGFMNVYSLNVYRGSNMPVATIDTSTNQAVNYTYQSTLPHRLSPDRFRGTLDQTIDPEGLLEISLQPQTNGWLPTTGFCAFSFELSAQDRKTNGYGTPGNRTLWRELIGITVTEE